jgi:hypothetical protein
LLIVVSVAGLVFGEEAARGEIQAQLKDLMGDVGADAVQGLLSSVREPAEGLTATAVGLVLLFVGATTVFAELQDALDRIWGVPERLRKSGWFTLVRARLMAFGMILALGFLLIVSLITSAMFAAMGRSLNPIFGGWQAVVEMGNAVGGFLLVAIMFGLIYKVNPGAVDRVIADLMKPREDLAQFSTRQVPQYLSRANLLQMLVEFHARGDASMTLTDVAAGDAFLGKSNSNIRRADLTDFTQVRFHCRVTGAATAGTLIKLRYHTAFSTTIGDFVDAVAARRAHSALNSAAATRRASCESRAPLTTWPAASGE